MNADWETKARTFAALHVPGDPLVLFNVWDAGSAKAVAEAGAKATATGSWSVAAAQGFADGEKMPLDLVLANLDRIVGAVDLPVTIDLEGPSSRRRPGSQGVKGAGARSVARADAAPKTGERLREWLASGAHGDMIWMEETAERRGSPAGLWPEVRS
jgi:hypothetical protein